MRLFLVSGLLCAAIVGGSVGCSHHSKKRGPGSDQGAGASLIRSEYSKGELTELCERNFTETMDRINAIAKLPAGERTVDNTLLAFEETIADYNDQLYPLTFMSYVSPNKELKAEAAACEEKSGPFGVEIMTRKDLYDALKDAQPRNPEEQRLLGETLREFEKNGLKLPADKLAQVKDLKQKLSVLEVQFATNLNNDATTVIYDEAELKGVSPDFLKRQKRTAEGKVEVTTLPPDYQHVMENAESAPARRKMMEAYQNRQAEVNTKLLEQAILLRQQIAAVFGFQTWADYRIWGRMAKDGKTALSFLNGLKTKLAKRNKQDLALLAKFLKKHDPKKKGIDAWDINYAAYQYKKRNLSLDDEQIREYFPADRVVQGLFDIYSKLFGVDFVEVRDAKAWSPEVKLYEIRDSKDSKILAYFYADFFPRDQKYKHFAAFSLIQGRQTPDGYLKPVSAIVANFNPPGADKPSLLKHDEVETAFHEFGHIMHQTLTRARYQSLAGTNVAQDFVESASQMLENWAWAPKILNNLSGHYQDPSRKLPADIMKKLIEARGFNKGYHYTRQLMLGLLDMTYHTASGPVDTTAVYEQLYRKLIGVEPLKGGRFQAGFGHLMGGYDAAYYGYLWSEVYALDMFTRFEKGGLLNPEVGMKYRGTILEKGRMVEPMDLLREFLGREPNNEAFFRHVKIKP